MFSVEPYFNDAREGYSASHQQGIFARMGRNILKSVGSICFSAVGLCLFAISASAQNKVVATAYVVEGSVAVRHDGAPEWSNVTQGMPLQVGDTVKTGEDGKAAFQFVDGALVRLGRLSALTFNDVTETGPTVTQSKGRAFFFSRGARKEPNIRTPLVNAAIYGTELVVAVTDDATTIDVLHGAIKASNAKDETGVSAGESVTARKGEPLKKSLLVTPADSVQWMIRFPFIVTASDLAPDADDACDTTCTKHIQTAIESPTSLLHSLSQLPASVEKTARAHLLKSIGLWSVGDKESALAALAKVPAKRSARDEAIQHLITGFAAILSGDSNSAITHADKADALISGLSNTALLRSYIAQAKGDVDDALHITTVARDTHPTVPELSDREAELLLSSDRPEDARALIVSRAQQFGSSAMTETLAGFTALASKEFENAAELFSEAIAKDPSQSLPYLGQALLQAQSRNYEAAKTKLSQAIQLDPSVAVYRSYLGKLFFEDENSPKAIEEFNAAVALDPFDPTPYLYRSYAKIAENDPIGGLEDVEESIARNEGRAVYRSSLLLDRDLAVRSAGLSRAFSELGFAEAARIEAIKSITDDYSNYSAHRLLSDSYQGLVETEGRLSEQRIADLMSPLSFNLFNSVGEQASLGDYNALFDKKETRKAFDLAWNSNHDEIGGSFLGTGKGEDYGYLVSYQPRYANGTRNGAFFSDNLFRTALQYETSANDRFIIDGSFKVREIEGQQDTDYGEDIHNGNVRLGYNHRFSTQLKFLTQAEMARDSEHAHEQLYRSVAVTTPDSSEPLFGTALVNENTDQRILRNSLSNQLIYASRYIDSVSGVDALYADTSRRDHSPVIEAPDLPPIEYLASSSATNLKSGKVYEYLSFKIPRFSTLTVGGAATRVERDFSEVAPFLDESKVQNEFSPKAGLVLTPTNWLTGRVAYFEDLRKTVLEDLSSLEPTLIGGINQRFNDLSGARSRNLGFGLDVKDADVIYAGSQYTRRHVVDSFGYSSDTISYDGQTATPEQPTSYGFTDSHANSDLVRSYVYTVLSRKSVFTADSLYEKYALTDDFTRAIDGYDTLISTQRYRFGYKYFIGKHLSLGTQATYRDQKLNQNDDSNGFWLFDVGANYRFSEQHGRVFVRVDNILDRDYTYNQSTGLEAPLLEGRSFVVGVTYNFW